MTERKTPILLREGPISGAIHALYRYKWKTLDNGHRVIESGLNGKWDVTADFDALVCELLLEPAPDIISILDGVARDLPLDDGERMRAEAFRSALVRLVERHNNGPHVKREAA